jgi:transposase InsO family protein
MKKVIARHPHHAWHCDLTTVPTSMGFWMPALPFGLAQRWPFCWWLVVLADQFSARILRVANFRNPPTTQEVQAIVSGAIDEAGVAPRYLVTDKGPQFRDRVFRGACKRKGIRHVFGALGQFGSIPFIERLILTIKKECTTRFLFPFSRPAARKELALFTAWYNRVRPHERLRGATPDEIHGGAKPFREPERFDPRGGDRLALQVRYLEGRKHLPIVTLKWVA